MTYILTKHNSVLEHVEGSRHRAEEWRIMSVDKVGIPLSLLIG